MTKQFPFTLLFICLLFGACDFFQPQSKKENGKIIAQAYDRYLYEKDLEQLVFDGLTSVDSTARVNLFIDKWLKTNAVLYQASDQLTAKQLELIDLKIEDYRQSLLMYSYEKALVEQKLDTTIKDFTILQYFVKNVEDFNSSENLVNVKYMIVPNKCAEIKEVKTWFGDLGLDSGVVEKLQNVSFKYNIPHNFKGQWFTFDELVKKMKINAVNSPKTFLDNNTEYEYTDSLNTYLLKIDKFTLIGDVLDPNYVSNDIKSLILNRKQKDFLQQTKESIYKEAVNQNKIHLYNKN